MSSKHTAQERKQGAAPEPGKQGASSAARAPDAARKPPESGSPAQAPHIGRISRQAAQKLPSDPDPDDPASP